MKQIIQKILRRIGFQLVKYPFEITSPTEGINIDLQRRFQIMDHLGINKLFDIGANAGQYGQSMRNKGFKHPIISFEPLRSAFLDLEKAAKKDDLWTVNHCALGEKDEKSQINVAGNSWSSSILDMLPMHENNAPESKYVAKEEISIKKLDSVFDEFVNAGDNVMLKIDTQGYEKNVIDGATNALAKVKMIQLEMSIVSLYSNELLFKDMIDYLNKRGFELFSLENGFASPKTGQLLQVDGVFVRKNL